MQRNSQGMAVSVSVGSVVAVFTMGTCILRATRKAMWVFAPSIEPMTANTSS